jgi:D-alanyl-lipoteichoic acid acyltransferase DltB (MBOAT superfamily)
VLFPTVTFGVFFMAVFAGSWLLRPYRAVWLAFLIVASFFFYGYWDTRFVALLAASIAANWGLGLVLGRERSRLEETARGDGPARWSWRLRSLTFAGVAINLGILGWFKYYDFFSTSLINRLADAGIDAPVPLIEIILPIGISFITFQAISYLVDVARGDAPALPPLEYAAYASFFPYLTAGPITRVGEFAPQLFARRSFDHIPFGEAALLIVGGLFKKVVISSYLSSSIVDPVFGNPEAHSSLELLTATYAYAIQIFMDFSGYTDIAIGCALLLGFRLPQNFDQPYRALTLQEFWRRWHISLSRWLRDYLFIPLGGSRGSKLETARNLMTTMLFGGLWHGAGMQFLAWGGIHGTALVAERAVYGDQPAKVTRLTSALAPMQWLITFNVVCFAWIFFRAGSIDNALTVIERIFTAPGPAPLVTPLILFTIIGCVALQFLPAGLRLRVSTAFERIGAAPQAALLGVGLFLVNYLGPEGVPPFIYFQF